MRKFNVFQNPYLLFSPFLVAFIIYILILPTDGKFGDQFRYLLYAQNLIHGFYSTPAPNIQLINGPGYPIILTPFLALKLPLLSITLMNAFFYYFSIIFLYKALNEIVSLKMSLTFSFIWASYCIAYQNMPFIHTETFTYLLVTLLIYSTLKVFKQDTQIIEKKHIIFTGFILGYIVLAKMIFGYAMIFMFIGFGLLWIVKRNNLVYKKGLMIMLVAFLTTAPYLFYTYNLTGRIFYWGTGSDNLYWMSTPYEKEYGDWTENLNQNSTIAANYNIHGADSVLRAHHQDDFIEINKYTGIEQDDIYKKLAIRNIKSHPIKYFKNIIYNIGRLIFHYPFSQAIEKPRNLLIFPINGALLTLMFFSLIPTIINWRQIPVYLQFLLVLTLLYLSASALVSAYVRMFTIIVPILLFWIAYIFQKTMKINLKFKDNP